MSYYRCGACFGRSSGDVVAIAFFSLKGTGCLAISSNSTMYVIIMVITHFLLHQIFKFT